LLQRFLPGPPHFRAASEPEAKGRNRTVYLLRDGRPVAASVEIGATDGSRTQILSVDFKPGDDIIIDQKAARS
jgi:HlyD family secretion protein